MGLKNISIQDLDKAVKASADVNRIRILRMLEGKKMCVCEIAFVLGITQPSVSRHLKKLKTAGFIAYENDGLWSNYYLFPKNPYAENFVENLNTWIVSDKTVVKDMKKLKTIDREKLCRP